MYAHHVSHTFLHPIPKYKKSPEPRKIPGTFLCTPDWIRTSDLQSRSLTLYPTELRARSPIILAQKCGKSKGDGIFFLCLCLTDQGSNAGGCFLAGVRPARSTMLANDAWKPQSLSWK